MLVVRVFSWPSENKYRLVLQTYRGNKGKFFRRDKQCPSDKGCHVSVRGYTGAQSRSHLEAAGWGMVPCWLAGHHAVGGSHGEIVPGPLLVLHEWSC